MAKIAKIDSARILAEVKDIQGADAATKRWTPEKQMKLIWNLFKTNPHFAPCFKELKPEENKAAFVQFAKDWDEGRLAYPSNTARSLAEAGLALGTDTTEFNADDSLK